MAGQYDFLVKHYCDTDIAEVAAMAARDRFGDYPNANESTVIYNIKWDRLVEMIEHAIVRSSYYPTIFSPPAFARLEDYQSAPQWSILLTEMEFVTATLSVDYLTTSYHVNKYSDGTIFVNATVAYVAGRPILGEIVHLRAAMGNSGGVVELKN
jgi:hypothetical protein